MSNVLLWDSSKLSTAIFARYCDFVTREYEPWHMEPPARGGFDVRIIQRRINDALLVDASSSVPYSRRSGAEVARSKRKWVAIVYQRRGRQRIRTSSIERIIGPGDIAIYSSTAPCEVIRDLDTRIEFSTLHLPMERVERSVSNLFDLQEHTLAHDQNPWRFLRAILGELFSDLRNVAELDASCAIESVVEFLGAASARVYPSDLRSSYKTQTLSRVRSYIETHLDDSRLSAAAVARDNGLSIRSLQRLFGESGTTVTRWIRTRRIQRCASDLRKRHLENRSVAEIAYRRGFTDVAYFYRAFKADAGVSPQRYRQLALRSITG